MDIRVSGSFGKMLRGATAASSSRFVRKHQTGLQTGCAILGPHQPRTEFPRLCSLPAFGDGSEGPGPFSWAWDSHCSPGRPVLSPLIPRCPGDSSWRSPVRSREPGRGGAGTPGTLQTPALRGRSCPDSLTAPELPRHPCSEQAASPSRWVFPTWRTGLAGGAGWGRWAGADAGVRPLDGVRSARGPGHGRATRDLLTGSRRQRGPQPPRWGLARPFLSLSACKPGD